MAASAAWKYSAANGSSWRNEEGTQDDDKNWQDSSAAAWQDGSAAAWQDGRSSAAAWQDTVDELKGSVDELKGTVKELKGSVDELKLEMSEVCGLWRANSTWRVDELKRASGRAQVGTPPPPPRSQAGTPPPRSQAGTSPMTTPPCSPGMSIAFPTTCRHGACNIGQDGMSGLTGMTVCNGWVINTLDEMHPWTSHLASTLFDKQYKLWETLYNHLCTYFKNYKISYATAKANRFLCIQCRVCGCAVFGTYGGEKDGAINSLARFFDVVLVPGEIQV